MHARDWKSLLTTWFNSCDNNSMILVYMARIIYMHGSTCLDLL